MGSRRLLLDVGTDADLRVLPSRGRISVKHGVRSVQVSIVCLWHCHMTNNCSCGQKKLKYRVIA